MYTFSTENTGQGYSNQRDQNYTRIVEKHSVIFATMNNGVFLALDPLVSSTDIH